MNFLWYKPEHKRLVLCDDEVLKKVEYHDCPGQLNGIDCGLFCIGVVLHFLDDIKVDRDTFTHRNCSRLRLKLSTHVTHVVHHGDDKDVMSQLTGQGVRDCFSLLQGASIVGAGGVEDVTPVRFLADMNLADHNDDAFHHHGDGGAAGGEDDDSDGIEVLEERSSKQRGRDRGRRNAEKDRRAFAAAEKDRRAMLELKNANKRISIASSQKPNHALSRKPNPNGGRPRKPKVLSDIESDDGGDAGQNVSAEQEGTVDSVDDQVLQHLLRKRGEELFKSLEDINPFIAEYKKVSGNDLKMKNAPLIRFVCTFARGTQSAPTRSLLGNDRVLASYREANRLATSSTPYDVVGGI